MLRLPFSPTSGFLCEEERGGMAAPKQLREVQRVVRLAVRSLGSVRGILI
jgi:hypothetical protein